MKKTPKKMNNKRYDLLSFAVDLIEENTKGPHICMYCAYNCYKPWKKKGRIDHSRCNYVYFGLNPSKSSIEQKFQANYSQLLELGLEI